METNIRDEGRKRSRERGWEGGREGVRDKEGGRKGVKFVDYYNIGLLNFLSYMYCVVKHVHLELQQCGHHARQCSML